MDWLADVCPLRRRCASAANWHVSGIVLGLRLGPRDSYRCQDVTPRLMFSYYLYNNGLGHFILPAKHDRGRVDLLEI